MPRFEETPPDGTGTRDRRGRARSKARRLLERDAQLAAIDALLEASRAGAEHALMIVGYPGMGKTRLHEAALDRARSEDLLVLRAAGAELEQNVAFGVAGELLRSLLNGISAHERDGLLADAPERIKSLHDADPDAEPAQSGEELAVSHGLFSLLATALERRAALLAIDDLHWCDDASLEFIVYLLHRLSELPLALLLTSRPVEGDDDSPFLHQIAAHPRIRLHSLRPLGPEAVRALVGQALGAVEEEALVEICQERTAGNPFYLHELLLALAAEPTRDRDQLTQRASAMAPDAVTRSLRIRVARLGTDAAALARAVAILGDDVPLRQAAALAGLSMTSAGAAAEALTGAEILLDREPLRYVHPLVRSAIELDLPASQRASRHLEAARLIYADGEGVERVAAHLLRGRPQRDPWVVERLRAAAHEARSRAAAQSAIRYLERALAEPPPDELRGEVLADLGAAEATIGLPSADQHLKAAEEAAVIPRRRAELALARGRALYARGLHEPAAHAFQAGLDQLAEAPEDDSTRELRARLQTGFVGSASIVPSLQAQALNLGASQDGQRLLLAQAAINASFAGEPAHKVVDLATRAWDGGRLLERETSYGVSWILVTAAFCLGGDLERSLEVAEVAADDARRRGAPLAFATASYMRGLPQLLSGWVDGALFDLELARDARRYGWQQFVRSAAAHYCLALVEAGQLDRAESVITEDFPLEPPYDAEDAIRLCALAELRRHQNRSEEALELATLAGEVGEGTFAYFGYCPWRASAAQAALALGDRKQARQLAGEALERAKRKDVLHERIRALRVAGMAEGGKAGLAKLRAAAELGEGSPPRLEAIYALVELGSALRRANERTEAREPLQRAADLAREVGALRLHERAREELQATGARPRRDVLLSGPEALTPSERRIAELAARGASNREIAGALFVTPKTVEYHLRNSYRKLDIRGRTELPRALGVS